MSRILPSISAEINQLLNIPIREERKAILKQLSDSIEARIKNNVVPKLIFICTHNSRRSQLGEIWSKVSATYFGISIESYSGGTEVTEVNSNVIETLKAKGFEVVGDKGNNPSYQVYFALKEEPKTLHSKIFSETTSNMNDFIAIITCSSADKNCPVVPGASQRILLTYEDPGKYDGTEEAMAEYIKTNDVISSEMLYVFSKINSRK